ncbi:Alkaline phosphatase synthesis transcriptional regulatory protein PhoP [Jeotgalicoccus aerolatus]|jgi:two-component system, OmpR family, alkaline phosphatase synthesis response regulator PhoP|uniref:Transcriptional regulatory protein SrrA n=1 Tax=Jeotgalicoccus aerolatus TaxID=709510 RepID=A0A1G9CFR9_9STAP|nr:response regulator transcription factor [Jeotgalicoccus aerolatus]MBP1951048.1 two-component system alkaline phosphatase synthesis response regulator PhoP [Jeotgalicoccus aerolatus]GGE00651.1 DNA-binding response regulator [Jeotgalicoccus aerolatus]CAD2078358.1 Alkaline phosphatase synthesis transcriptional regulatory protein PhoP [Jeotgalicoccus aerolatus]SDK50436.1 two-component system, OmpR family, alkaline phosphatase synthesis response regulator PhoP [Jeotgalicoccus aerolatus]
MKKLLVVDDEPSILTLLKFNLEQSGFEVLTAENGNDALEIATTEDLTLIVLDLMLPGMDGMDVCKTLRQEKINTPILMLTAKDDEFDKILGLELGADDYMTKPFSPREVVARVKAILRRTTLITAEAKDEIIKIGDLEIHPDKYMVMFKGEQLVLTPKEFELLLYLANHRGKVLSRDQLLNGVWDFHYDGDTRIVDVHISHLREKIESDTKQPVYIRTIRGFGYKMEGQD